MRSSFAVIASFLFIYLAAAQGQQRDTSDVRRIVLNIEEQTIEREHLYASTALEIEEERTRVAAGATVQARRLLLRLVGVKGVIYYHATLPASLRQRFGHSRSEEDP